MYGNKFFSLFTYTLITISLLAACGKPKPSYSPQSNETDGTGYALQGSDGKLYDGDCVAPIGLAGALDSKQFANCVIDSNNSNSNEESRGLNKHNPPPKPIKKPIITNYEDCTLFIKNFLEKRLGSKNFSHHAEKICKRFFLPSIDNIVGSWNLDVGAKGIYVYNFESDGGYFIYGPKPDGIPESLWCPIASEQGRYKIEGNKIIFKAYEISYEIVLSEKSYIYQFADNHTLKLTRAEDKSELVLKKQQQIAPPAPPVPPEPVQPIAPPKSSDLIGNWRDKKDNLNLAFNQNGSYSVTISPNNTTTGLGTENGRYSIDNGIIYFTGLYSNNTTNPQIRDEKKNYNCGYSISFNLLSLKNCSNSFRQGDYIRISGMAYLEQKTEALLKQLNHCNSASDCTAIMTPTSGGHACQVSPINKQEELSGLKVLIKQYETLLSISGNCLGTGIPSGYFNCSANKCSAPRVN